MAKGNNEKSTGDLYQTAARVVAEWATIKVSDSVFPIQVLEKNEDAITINRGSDSGIQIGQVYGVNILGKEIKDPSTGELLGREEKTVGKATILELQPKFSKAKVWNDKGVINGAVLRLAGTR